MVPAVSIISSINTATFPFTSPIIFITSATFAFGRRLSIIAIGACKNSANLRARVTPPWSGETTTMSLSLKLFSKK